MPASSFRLVVMLLGPAARTSMREVAKLRWGLLLVMDLGRASKKT
jgi:hypothetical protein